MILVDCINSLGFVMRIITRLVYYLRILIPVILIVLIMFDLAKVVISNEDEKAKKEVSSKVVKRLIYAVIIFLIPTIVSFIFTRLVRLPSDDLNGDPTSFVSCWQYYYNQI